MIKRYYSLETEGEKADLYIYGDITSWPWLESDVSAYLLSKKLEELKDDEALMRIREEAADGDEIHG